MPCEECKIVLNMADRSPSERIESLKRALQQRFGEDTAKSAKQCCDDIKEAKWTLEQYEEYEPLVLASIGIDELLSLWAELHHGGLREAVSYREPTVEDFDPYLHIRISVNATKSTTVYDEMNDRISELESKRDDLGRGLSVKKQSKQSVELYEASYCECAKEIQRHTTILKRYDAARRHVHSVHKLSFQKIEFFQTAQKLRKLYADLVGAGKEESVLPFSLNCLTSNFPSPDNSAPSSTLQDHGNPGPFSEGRLLSINPQSDGPPLGSPQSNSEISAVPRLDAQAPSFPISDTKLPTNLSLDKQEYELPRPGSPEHGRPLSDLLMPRVLASDESPPRLPVPNSPVDMNSIKSSPPDADPPCASPPGASLKAESPARKPTATSTHNTSDEDDRKDCFILAPLSSKKPAPSSKTKPVNQRRPGKKVRKPSDM